MGAQLAGSTVVMNSDNLRAVAAVNSGYSKVPKAMHLLRCLFYPSALNFSVRAVYVPGAQNGWANATSRNQLSDFFAQVPRAVSRRQPIPPSLLGFL